MSQDIVDHRSAANSPNIQTISFPCSRFHHNGKPDQALWLIPDRVVRSNHTVTKPTEVEELQSGGRGLGIHSASCGAKSLDPVVLVQLGLPWLKNEESNASLKMSQSVKKIKPGKALSKSLVASAF